MRVVKVDIQDLPDFGLKSIQMDRLGPVVILAGKNGAGKSRLLGRLNAWATEAISPFGPQSKWDAGIRGHLAIDDASTGLWKRADVQVQVEDRWRQSPTIWRNMFDLEFDSQGSPSFVHFVPKQLAMIDPAELPPNVLRSRSAQLDNIGIESLNENALSRIQTFQNRWHNARHQDSNISTDDRNNATDQYNSLNSIIKRFLGAELRRNTDGDATLFGFPIGKAHFSDGQKILLQFCTAVHAQASKLSELIVLMDEPENHLHPGAMLDAITAIKNALTNGQLWIATHSIPLLAHFDPEAIWWMHDGGVQHAGSQPEKVLLGLIGDDDRISRLGDFLGLPAALAACNFAYQCLLPPAVLNTGPDDPQTTQIASVLTTHYPNEMLRVLDFGAGRGRLVSALRECGTDLERVKTRIDYRAYDTSSAYREDCEAAIARLYGTADHRYFTRETDLRAQVDAHSVDVIVMCNVLHEIDPEKWLSLFSEHSLIRQLLKPDGFLLLVEDMGMRIGEKAHQHGFLVMDTAELKTFFKITENDVSFKVNDARKDGRLKAHLIPANCLGRATNVTLRETLEQVKHLAGEEIKALRMKEPGYREGRKHALYVHQLANATLALESLGK
jgi:SAM-dependent methyltransferase